MKLPFPPTASLVPAFCALAWLTWAGPAALGATLSGAVNTSPPSPANLTTAGTLDWAIWGTTSGTTSLTKAPVNDKNNGSTILGSLSEVTGGNLRGGVASTQTVSFTDGTAPASGSGTFGLIFAQTLNSVGKGVQLSIAGDPAVQRILQIWASGTNGIGTFTASLNGAAPVVLTSQTYGGTKTPTLFTVNYQPDVVADLLTIQYVLSTDTPSTTDNSHVGFQAAAISAVPEPVSVGLLLGGAGLLLGMRRRKSAGA